MMWNSFGHFSLKSNTCEAKFNSFTQTAAYCRRSVGLMKKHGLILAERERELPVLRRSSFVHSIFSHSFVVCERVSNSKNMPKVWWHRTHLRRGETQRNCWKWMRERERAKRCRFQWNFDVLVFGRLAVAIQFTVAHKWQFKVWFTVIIVKVVLNSYADLPNYRWETFLLFCFHHEFTMFEETSLHAVAYSVL